MPMGPRTPATRPPAPSGGRGAFAGCSGGRRIFRLETADRFEYDQVMPEAPRIASPNARTQIDAATDSVAVEAPLEVRLNGHPFAVIMRTPGADRELAAGFLLAEQVIRSADELGTIERCKDKVENVITVTLAGPAAARLDRLLADRRQVAVNASCGMCGRQTIDSLRADRAPLSGGASIRGSTVALLPDRLRAAQAAFDVSGGLHAAGLFTVSGALEALAEDVAQSVPQGAGLVRGTDQTPQAAVPTAPRRREDCRRQPAVLLNDLGWP